MFQNIFNEKLSFIQSIKIAIKSWENMQQNINTVPSLTIDIPENKTGISELTVIDLSWYTPFKPYGDIVITAFMYIFFLWRLYLDIPNIVNGVASSFGEVSSMPMNNEITWTPTVSPNRRLNSVKSLSSGRRK